MAGTLLKRMAGIGASALLALTLLALAFFLMAPRLLDCKFFTVLGGSMSPAIPLGAVVAIRPVAPSDIQVGDIITYGPSGTSGLTITVVHRVVAVETRADGSLSFITKGDGSGSEDQYVVFQENVIGWAWFYIPLLGYLWGYSRTPIVFILLVAIPGLALIAMEGGRLVALFRKPNPALLAVSGQRIVGEVSLSEKGPVGRECPTACPKENYPEAEVVPFPPKEEVDRMVAEIMERVSREVLGGSGPVKD